VPAERGGATVREVMALMRHSDPKLTLRYGRLRAHDLTAAVEKLLSLGCSYRFCVAFPSDPFA
jgi:hypothetical protein